MGRFEPGRVYSRISPSGWEGLYAEPRFARANFLLREVRRRSEPFRWSEVARVGQAEADLWSALPGFAITDGIAVPVHGPGGEVGLTSLAFEDLDAIAPAERAAVAMAGLVLHLRMRALTALTAPDGAGAGSPLSPRERDCLAFVAEGCSDWEIGERLAVAETTVFTHIQNARRKLGARTRAQAVALCVAAGLI